MFVEAGSIRRRVVLLGMIVLGLVSLASGAAAQGGRGSQGKGRLALVFNSIKNPAHREWEALFKSSADLKGHLDSINEEIALPRDIRVEFTECGEANAFYNPERTTISLCYEMIERMGTLFEDDAETKDERNAMVYGSTLWTLYHELGHGLVHLLELPITGKEDDAVDELATIVLIRAGDADSALSAAREWFVTGIEEVESADGVEDLPFYDEHSLSMQRFYNIVCLVTGSDPDEFGDMAEEFPELENRGCQDEFEKRDTTWDKLLAPYYKRPV